MLYVKGVIQCECGDSHAVKNLVSEDVWAERVASFATRHQECEEHGKLPKGEEK